MTASGSGGLPRVRRAYRALLRLTCPASYRERFGRDMEDTFAAEWADARSRGGLAPVRCALLATWDALRSGTALHAGVAADAIGRPRLRLPNPVPLALTTLACGTSLGLAMAVTHVVTLVARPALGVRDQSRVVAVYRVDPLSGLTGSLSLDDLDRLRLDADSLGMVAGYLRMPVQVRTGARTRTVVAEVVSEDFFTTLGVGPGQRPNRPGEVWLSERLARATDPTTTGAVVVNDVAYTLAGTVPATFLGVNFDWHQAPDLWISTADIRQLHAGFRALDDARLRHAPMLVVVARPRAGASLARVYAEVDAALRVAGSPATTPGSVSRVLPIDEATTHPMQRQRVVRGLAVLGVVAAMAYLLAVSTLVAYLAATVLALDREHALRASLGATTARLCRQTVARTLIAPLAAMTVAIAVMHLALRDGAQALTWLGVPALSAVAHVPTWRLGATVVVTLASTALLAYAGVVLRVRRLARSPTTVLRDPQTVAAGRWRLGILCLQAAIAASVAIPCAQYTAAWYAAAAASPGFDTTHLSLLDLEHTRRQGSDMPEEDVPQRILGELGAMPEVHTAAMASFGPWSRFRANGQLKARQGNVDTALPVEFNAVSDEYFEALGIAAVSGRTFASGTRAENRQAVVINRTAAESLGGPARAIGTTMALAGSSGYEGSATVVGVVANLTYHLPWESPVAMVYVPLTRTTPPHLTVVVRTRSQPTAELHRSIAAAIERASPSAAVSRTVTWRGHVHAVLAGERLLATLLVVLGLVTAVASAIGLWSALHEQLHAQTRHTAIRVALGATLRFLVGPAMGRPAAAMAVGLAVGVLAGLLVNQHVILHPGARGPWLWAMTFLVLLVAMQVSGGIAVVRTLRDVRPAPLLRQTS